MSQQKKQHYVPVFYLKEFSPDGKRINLWNIRSKKKRLSVGLKGQCQKNFFYGDDRILEEKLGDIESRTSKVLKDVADKNRLPSIWHHDYKVLMRYILTQHLRTAYASEVMIDQTKQLKDFLKNFKDHVPEHLEKEIDQKYEMIKQVAPQMGILSSFCGFDLISDLAIKLLINKTQTEFITSDHPVVLYNQLLHYDPQIQQKIPIPKTGLGAKGIQLFFPISPTKVLLMYDDNVYSVGNNHKTNTVPIYHKQHVMDINMLQMCSGNQNIYFKNDTFDIDKLHKISEQYIQKALNDFHATPEPKEEDFTDSEQRISQFVVIAPRGVYTNLNLSFIQLKPEAKQFQAKVKRNIEIGTVPVGKFWRKLPVDDVTDRLKPFADIIEPIREKYVEAMKQDVGEHWHQAIKSFLKMP